MTTYKQQQGGSREMGEEVGVEDGIRIRVVDRGRPKVVRLAPIRDLLRLVAGRHVTNEYVISDAEKEKASRRSREDDELISDYYDIDTEEKLWQAKARAAKIRQQKEQPHNISASPSPQNLFKHQQKALASLVTWRIDDKDVYDVSDDANLNDLHVGDENSVVNSIPFTVMTSTLRRPQPPRQLAPPTSQSMSIVRLEDGSLGLVSEGDDSLAHHPIRPSPSSRTKFKYTHSSAASVGGMIDSLTEEFERPANQLQANSARGGLTVRSLACALASSRSLQLPGPDVRQAYANAKRDALQPINSNSNNNVTSKEKDVVKKIGTSSSTPALVTNINPRLPVTLPSLKPQAPPPVPVIDSNKTEPLGPIRDDNKCHATDYIDPLSGAVPDLMTSRLTCMAGLQADTVRWERLQALQKTTAAKVRAK